MPDFKYQENGISNAINTLKDAMKDDPELAYVWHANVACPIMDAGVSHRIANKAATRVMKHLFDVDTVGPKSQD